MKRFDRLILPTAFVALFSGLAFSQDGSDRPDRPGDRRGPEDAQERPQRPRPPLPPLVRALDADRDGEISAEEIANAAKALATLDQNGDGKLTRDEIAPPRPAGPPPRGEGRPDGPPPGGGAGNRRPRD